MCVSVCLKQRYRADELGRDSTLSLCQGWQRRSYGCRGSRSSPIQTHLIASCDKWRGQCGGIITTRTVGVNRRGTRTIAPQMSVFKQWGIFITLLSFCGFAHLDYFYAHWTQWIQREINKLQMRYECTLQGLINCEYEIQLDFKDLHCISDLSDLSGPFQFDLFFVLLFSILIILIGCVLWSTL